MEQICSILLNNTKKLKSISFNSVMDEPTTPTWNSFIFQMLQNHHQSLENLDLPIIPDVESFPNLTYLSLTAGADITANEFKIWFPNFLQKSEHLSYAHSNTTLCLSRD
jgi:hypothetical protein